MKTVPSTVHFTPRLLNGLNSEALDSAQKARQFTDDKVSDLKLELTRAGKKTFAFRAQRDGRKQYHFIGSYPATSIEDARKIALEFRSQLDRGINVSAERQRIKTEPTLSEFFHQQYLPHAKASGKKSWPDDVGRFQRIDLAFGNSKLSAVTRRELESFLHGLRSGKKALSPASCNRYQALLGAIYRCALNWQLVPASPVAGIAQMRENNARTRSLSEHEQAAFIRAADADPNQTAAAILKGLVLTGCRKSELQFARWEDVDINRAQLTLRKTKNGHTRVVLLNDEALALISNLASRDTSPWLFPSASAPENAIVNIDKAWRRIIASAGKILGQPIRDVRIHDLRHTFASQLANANCSLHLIAQTLGHRTVGQSARYAHFRNDVLREASNAASEAFRKAKQVAAGVGTIDK